MKVRSIRILTTT